MKGGGSHRDGERTGSRRDTNYEVLMAIPPNPLGGYNADMVSQPRIATTLKPATRNPAKGPSCPCRKPDPLTNEAESDDAAAR
jgi:hypothetical protein